MAKDPLVQLTATLRAAVPDATSPVHLAAVRAGWRIESESHWLDMGEIAQLMNVGRRTVSSWRRQGMPPPDARTRKFNLREFLRWRVEHEREKKSKTKTLESAQLALIEERTKSVRQKREVDARKLVTVAEATEACVTEVRNARSDLLALPRVVASDLAGKTVAEIETLLEEAIHRVLTRLSEGRP